MTVTIRQAKDYPYFFIEDELPKRVFNVLYKELSYASAGHEHSTKFQKGEWDGLIRLLRRARSGKYYFPTGLSDRVKKILDTYGIDYQFLHADYEFRDLGLKYHGPPLREYQMEAVLKAIKKGQGIIALPTGAGKTLVGLKLIHALDKPTLITVHTKTLLYQWSDEIVKNLKTAPGLLGDGHNDLKPITVAMMQTAVNTELPKYDVWVSDEVHHVPCNTHWEVALKCGAVFRFGLSATPKREDGADLAIVAGTGDMVANITAEQLIDWGYLAKPRFVILNPPKINLPKNNWQKAYKEGIVTNEERNKMLCDTATRFSKQGLSTYIHVERKNHGNLLANRLGCPFLSGKDSTKKRNEILKDFEDGEIRVLVSTLLGEGVDLPRMDAVILAHGMKTSVGTIQKIGRALRTRKDKKEAIIVDFADKGPYINKHFENRYRTMSEYYGKYFQP